MFVVENSEKNSEDLVTQCNEQKLYRLPVQLYVNQNLQFSSMTINYSLQHTSKGSNVEYMYTHSPSIFLYYVSVHGQNKFIEWIASELN